MEVIPVGGLRGGIGKKRIVIATVRCCVIVDPSDAIELSKRGRTSLVPFISTAEMTS